MPLKNMKVLLRALPLFLFMAGLGATAEAAVSKTSKKVIRYAANPALKVVPGFTAAALSTSSLQWSWSTGTFTGSGITGYHLYSSSTAAVIDLLLDTTYYIDAGLGVNKQFTRWITSYDGSGQGSDSDHIEKYTYALPPTTITVSTVAAESAYVTWIFSSAAAYAVECSTDNGATYIRNRDVFVPWQTIRLLSNRDYLIRLGAVNGDNELTPGVYSQVNMKTTPPLDLAMTGVALSSYTIQWQWSTGTFTGTGITGYRIYGSSTTPDETIPADGASGDIVKDIPGETANSWIEIFKDSTTVTWAVETGSVTAILSYAANSRHTRWIKAVGKLESAGGTPYQKYTYAVAPATTTAEGFGETVMVLKWPPAQTQASKWAIEYSTAADFTLSRGSTVVSGTPGTATGLTENTKYDFRIGAINGDDEQTPYYLSYATSAVYRAMTMPAPPFAFSVATLTDTVLNFSWSTATYINTSYIDGYGIGIDCYIPAPINEWRICQTAFAPGITTNMYGLDYLYTNSVHTRYVRASQTDPDWKAGNPAFDADPKNWDYYYDHIGSVYTPSATGATFATPPNDVSFFSVRSSTVGLSWKEPIIPATKYRVERSVNTGEKGPWVFVSSVAGASFQDTGLAPSTTYSYRIGAINLLGFQTIGLSTATDGNRRDYSFVSSTITMHTSPTLSGVATSTTSITWSWTNAVPGVLTYNLYTSTDGMIAAGLGATTYAELNLSSANARYARRVRSFTSSGEGDYSEKAVSTLANPPAAPVITSSGVHTLSLDWTGNGSTRYKLDRSPDKNSWTSLRDWTGVFVSTYFNDTNLRFATTYYYAVSGYNFDGVVSVSSAITAAAMTLPPPPSYTVVFATAAVGQSVTKPLPGLGQVTVTIPAGTPDGYFDISTSAAASPIDITKSELDAATAKLTSVSLLSGSIMELHFYDVYGLPLTANLPAPARISVTYTDATGDNIVDGTQFQAASLRLFSLETTQLVWSQLVNSSLDKTTKTVYADIPHFSFYALGSIISAAGTIADVFAYPNPYKPGSAGVFGQSVYGDGIVFESLPARSRVKIFNLAGGLMRELTDEDGDGRCLWDARNKDGARAASGIYLYLVTSPAGGKKSGRIAIIK